MISWIDSIYYIWQILFYTDKWSFLLFSELYLFLLKGKILAEAESETAELCENLAADRAKEFNDLMAQ